MQIPFVEMHITDFWLTANGKENLPEVGLTQQSAPLGKGVPGFKLWQLSMPQNRPSSQSLLLSQSPSLSVHLFSVLQHDHVSLSVNGCPGVPVQSHEIEFTEFQNIEKHRYTGG